MPVWKGDLAAIAYDGSAVEDPEALKIAKPANAVATLRSEPGYLSTKYDPSPAKRQNPLRCQFGQKYAVKKVRNSGGSFGELRVCLSEVRVLRFGPREIWV